MPKLKKTPLVPMKMMSSVYIGTGNGKLSTALMRGFDALGGIEKVVKPGQSVLLKVNLVEGHEAISGGITAPYSITGSSMTVVRDGTEK